MVTCYICQRGSQFLQAAIGRVHLLHCACVLLEVSYMPDQILFSSWPFWICVRRCPTFRSCNWCLVIITVQNNTCSQPPSIFTVSFCCVQTKNHSCSYPSVCTGGQSKWALSQTKCKVLFWTLIATADFVAHG